MDMADRLVLHGGASEEEAEEEMDAVAAAEEEVQTEEASSRDGLLAVGSMCAAGSFAVGFITWHSNIRVGMQGRTEGGTRDRTREGRWATPGCTLVGRESERKSRDTDRIIHTEQLHPMYGTYTDAFHFRP